MGYSFIELKALKYLNVELTTRCSVRCPMCPRTVFPEIVPQNLDMPLDFLSRLKLGPNLEKIYLIGANGEPTQHPRFLEIVAKLKKITSAQIYINTHGCFKPAGWWKDLTSLLSPADHIVFSIDGLEDTNHLYRVNAKWTNIESSVKACAGRVITTWKFIVFRHNEHQLLQAMKVAKDWGVDYFSLKRSDRWGEPYWPRDEMSDWMSDLKPSESFITTDYSDVEGTFSAKRKFNSIFNVSLKDFGQEEIPEFWRTGCLK